MTRSRVLFCATAGPRRGFGHLVRCRVLADALETPCHVSLRASVRTQRTARALGWTVHADAIQELATWRPDLLVIDEPSVTRATRWLAAARRLGIPVASIHDLGLARIPSDLSIDGGVQVRAGRQADLSGPDYAILHADIARLRQHSPQRARARVLVALGGGGHVRWTGASIARAMTARMPGVSIDLAAGFTSDASAAPPLPPRCRWVYAPHGLAPLLARATAAIVGGGVTLYEAAALGTPTVALPVVAAQRPTVQAFAAAGAALGVTDRDARRACDAAADAAVVLLRDRARAARLAHAGAALVDGHGGARVAILLRQIMRAGATRRRRQTSEVRHAA